MNGWKLLAFSNRIQATISIGQWWAFDWWDEIIIVTTLTLAKQRRQFFLTAGTIRDLLYIHTLDGSFLSWASWMVLPLQFRWVNSATQRTSVVVESRVLVGVGNLGRNFWRDIKVILIIAPWRRILLLTTKANLLVLLNSHRMLMFLVITDGSLNEAHTGQVCASFKLVKMPFAAVLLGKSTTVAKLDGVRLKLIVHALFLGNKHATRCLVPVDVAIRADLCLFWLK